MMDAVNADARQVDGRTQYPSMFGSNGWYGWKDTPWNVGALEVWYWSQRPSDLERVRGENGWVRFLLGKYPSYPEEALERNRRMIGQRMEAMRRDTTPPEKRLADNMLDYNPAATRRWRS